MKARWYLVTPEQYDRAPIGTEVYDDGGCPCGCYWTKKTHLLWQHSLRPDLAWWGASFRREVKKWGAM